MSMIESIGKQIYKGILNVELSFFSFVFCFLNFLTDSAVLIFLIQAFKFCVMINYQVWQ